jgi:mono/diheme cytochrome c family protein
VAARDLSKAQAVTLVTKGGGFMPAFSGDLSPAQIEQVVVYMRKL